MKANIVHGHYVCGSKTEIKVRLEDGDVEKLKREPLRTDARLIHVPGGEVSRHALALGIGEHSGKSLRLDVYPVGALLEEASYRVTIDRDTYEMLERGIIEGVKEGGVCVTRA